MGSKGKAGERVAELLKQFGMELVRNKKHEVWKHPDGRVFVMSSTPSDAYAEAQQLRSLEKFLDIVPEKGKPGERREKKTCSEPQRRAEISMCSTGAQAGVSLKDQLSALYKQSEDDDDV